jgi:hypothetical protein
LNTMTQVIILLNQSQQAVYKHMQQQQTTADNSDDDGININGDDYGAFATDASQLLQSAIGHSRDVNMLLEQAVAMTTTTTTPATPTQRYHDYGCILHMLERVKIDLIHGMFTTLVGTVQ